MLFIVAMSSIQHMYNIYSICALAMLLCVAYPVDCSMVFIETRGTIFPPLLSLKIYQALIHSHTARLPPLPIFLDLATLEEISE